MFDDDLSTYWHGFEPVTLQNNVVVTFKIPIIVRRLFIVTRPAEKQSFHGSYKSMCLVLDNDSKTCTSADNQVNVGESIMLTPYHNTRLLVTQVELIIQNGSPGQIADLKIYYEGKIQC